jgi:hypothetical protein
MRTPLLLTLAVLGSLLPCRSAEIGLGVSMRGDSSTIYVPVTLSPSWILEARFAFNHSRNDQAWGAQRYSSTGTSENLDLGIFWTRQLSEKTRLYLGPRIGGGHSEWRSTQDGDPYVGVSKSNNFIFAPVIGLEYFPVKSVSLGGEVGANYGKSHDSYDYAQQPSQAHGSDGTGTFTALILRYHF